MPVPANGQLLPDGVRNELLIHSKVQSHRRRVMDEAQTLALLAWIIGGIVGVAFVLNAIALSMS